MAFEVSRGRSCDTLANRQETELNKLKAVQLADGEVIRLKTAEVTHLDEVIDAMQRQYNSVVIIKDEQIHKLKVRIRKMVVMLIGETGLIVILVILLL